MPEDQIEMLWRCGDKGCNNENRGRFKKCERCGRPKGTDDGFYMPGDISHEAAVTDTEELRHATGGEDWSCRFCDSKQFRADGCCANCGVDQTTGEKRVTEESVSYDPDTDLDFQRIKQQLWIKWGRFFTRSFLPCIGVFIASYLLIAWLRPRVVDATVSSISWHTVVHVDLYSKHYYDGFSPTGDAVDILPMGTRTHHYNHVLVGHHDHAYNHRYSCGQTCTPVPRTCYTTPRSCRSNKNGYATCSGGDRVCSGGGQSCSTKYCDETLHESVPDYIDVPVTAPYFQWKVWEWAHERDVPQDGADFTPVYADPQLQDHFRGDSERVAGRDMELSVFFTKDKESWTYHPKGVEEFSHFDVGSSHRIRIGILHRIEVIK